MSDRAIIPSIVDKHLAKIIRLKINALPKEIVPEMRSDEACEDEGWAFWLPVAARVRDGEIAAWEGRIGHPLPPSYRAFLQYKHFYELMIGEASFFAHPAGEWQESLAEVVFSPYARPFLLDKGYIPFADWSDWGYLCFDTNGNPGGDDYPVVLWDHESVEEVRDFADSFTALLQKLDEQERHSPVFR